MANKIKVIVKRPDEAGHVTWMSNTLEAFQKAVGGYIEAVSLIPGVVIICDEEGRLKGSAPNCRIDGMDFVGNIVVAGVNDEEFDSIPEALTLKVFRELIG